MLEPNELPDELHALERELSQPAREEISDELRSRVMSEVRMTMRQVTPRRTVRYRTLVAVGGLVTVAALVLMVLRQHDESPEQRPPSPRQTTMSNQEELQSAPLPTYLAYRLSPDDSPEDWEELIEQRADSFIVNRDEQALVIAWHDRSAMLELGD